MISHRLKYTEEMNSRKLEFFTQFHGNLTSLQAKIVFYLVGDRNVS